ncbi:MAG TPA: carbohydrate-binding family 9-like protein, partial [Prolixibacteraceae bacterium]
MSGIKIPYLKGMFYENQANISEKLMASGALINIDKINWKDFPHIPEVKVYLGYCEQRLWLHYLVKNDFVRAVCREDQEQVWQDSCVEFFMRQGDIYRNFEFNSLGVCLSAFGPDRNARERLDAKHLAQILRFPSIKIESLPTDEVPQDWSLTVAIPLELMAIKSGSQFMANFYKCGD